MIRTAAQNKRIYGIIGDIKKLYGNESEKIINITNEFKRETTIRISGQEKSSLLTEPQADILIKELEKFKEYILYLITNDKPENEIFKTEEPYNLSFKLIRAINDCYNHLEMKHDAKLKLQLRILKHTHIRNNAEASKVYEAVKSMAAREYDMDIVFNSIKFLLAHQDKMTDWERNAIWDYYRQITKKKKLDSPAKIHKVIEIYYKVCRKTELKTDGGAVDGGAGNSNKQIFNEQLNQKEIRCEIIEFPVLQNG
ncbi:MAG TPA: hypothetical protein PKY81_16360 [bacterium]|nr:hypothetical protein [bacterium]HPN32527.1 hypothetical protein [bacterium]